MLNLFPIIPRHLWRIFSAYLISLLLFLVFVMNGCKVRLPVAMDTHQEVQKSFYKILNAAEAFYLPVWAQNIILPKAQSCTETSHKHIGQYNLQIYKHLPQLM